MGKKAKVGKARKDKYYQLAKDTGYRSRAAFKLLQLNRKYEFLQKSRVCIDLCAAPGGWLQVASQLMPVSSIILGIDLAPIRPIHNVTTFQEDITSDKCRQILNKELQTWKADVVLHDGAPNVGMNWLHDAFQQATLTLKALKLATEFLRKGGWFITKIFRSKDYNSLLWVFHQLFRKVFATKPQASRNESAEIFVVCQHFLAPDKIDPKLLDSKYVFSEVAMDPTTSGVNLVHPEKEKRKAEGYPEGKLALESKLLASEYIKSENHWQLLANCTQIVFDDKSIADHPLTTDEIREYCTDIKVLGKPALKSLSNWRTKLCEFYKPSQQADNSQERDKDESEAKDDNDSDDDDDDSTAVKKIEEEKKKDLKKKRKKVMKEKRKLRDKMRLNMVIPGDKIDVGDETDMFSLKTLRNIKDLETVEAANSADIVVEENGISLDDDETGAKNRKRTMAYDRCDDENDDNMDVDDDEDVEPESADDSAESSDDETNDDRHNPLIVNLQKPTKTAAAKNWFNKPVFAGIKDEDDDFEVVPVSASKHPLSSDDDDDVDDEDDADDVGSDTEAEPKITVTGSKSADITTTDDKPNKIVKLSPLELAVGEEMVKSRKRRRELVEMSYHRYTHGDEAGLPDWFVEDERKHCRIERPVTKEQIEAYKAKQKAIDAAPIKKVAEAKARKKRKMVKRLEKVRKKAETVTDSVDISDKAKMKQIKDIYKKAGLLKSEKKEVAYVVGKKGVGKRVSRPPGVKGRFRVVDPRMKKDNKKKKLETKGGKRKGGKAGKAKGRKSR
jgi:AdoMet-dependent rRNA methyltransferase SPB1